jgi:II/X family phage/plasmid replication protein
MCASRRLQSAGASVIDWLTAHVQIRAAAGLNTGEVSCVDADGVVEWVSAKRKNVQGSHSGTISVKRFRNGLIEFAGSPAKFLQGHNVFGSDDLLSLGSAMIERACATLGLELLDSELADIQAGRYDLKRVDINYSFATGTRENALAWIKTAASVLDLPRRGGGWLDRSTTVMWGGKKSRYWKLKAYCKGKELEAHELAGSLPKRTELQEWSDDKLRIELELHARQLQKRGLECASSWRIGTAQELFREYLAKLRLGGHLMLSVAAVQSLPYRLRPTYTNWARGEDLRQLMSRPTYYRHCRELLEFGINIAVPPQQEQVSSIPLSQYLETPCMEVPVWAVGTEVYCNPACDNERVVEGKGSIRVRQESGVTRMAAKAAPGAPQPLVVSNHEESVHTQTQLERHNPLGEAA